MDGSCRVLGSLLTRCFRGPDQLRRRNDSSFRRLFIIRKAQRLWKERLRVLVLACVCWCCGVQKENGRWKWKWKWREKISNTEQDRASVRTFFLVVSCLLTEAEPKGIVVNNEFPL